MTEKAWLEFAKFGIAFTVLGLAWIFLKGGGFNLLVALFSFVFTALVFALFGLAYRKWFQGWSACLPAWFSLGLIILFVNAFFQVLSFALGSKTSFALDVWLWWLALPFVFSSTLGLAYQQLKKKTPVEINY